MPYEKVGDNEPVCIADEVPFEIPDGWEWCRLNTISYMVGNKYNQIKTSEIKKNGEIPVVSQGQSLIDGFSNEKSKIINDVPLIMFGDHTKNIKYIDFPFVIGADGTKFHKIILCNDKYIYYWMMYVTINIVNRGYARHHSLLLQEFLPLPPLQEQQRIVTEIEKYLPLINEYDKLQTELDTLDKEFPEKLKKSILQQAIKGKLVEQDPSDEPASVLLDKIREEKVKLIKEGKIKKDKNESIIYKRYNSYYEKFITVGAKQCEPIEKCIDDEIPFEIPESWAWCRLENISETNIGLTYKPSDKTDNGILVLRSNNIQSGLMNYEDCVYVSCRVSPRVMIDKNDILICVRNGSRSLVGKCAIVDKDGMAFGAFMAKIKSTCYLYIKIFIDSPVFRNRLDGVKTETINQITQDMLKKQLLPLPPFEEQSRIVNKVNEIFNNIDILL